jgi:16S rRNA (cytosine967-C5)-methyltransferase
LIPAISSARSIAWQVLNQAAVSQQWVEELLAKALQKEKLGDLDRRLCSELVLGTIKAQVYLDYAIGQHLAQGKKPKLAIANLLRLGAYQMLLLSRIPRHAAVFETVQLAKQKWGKQQANFINAVLRKIAGQGPPVLPEAKDYIRHTAIRYSFPDWIVKRWTDRYGREKAERLLLNANEPAALYARWNPLQITRPELEAAFSQAGFTVEFGWAPEAFKITPAADPTSLPGFKAGWFYIQDPAAQWIAHLAAPKPQDSCLDLCSAPGGKATHLAQLMQDKGAVLAFDSNTSRLKYLQENISRLKLQSVRIINQLPMEMKFDQVLVDAPCSGLGTLRRHSQIRWRSTAEDSLRLAGQQIGLLRLGAKMVKSGGTLIYATCTTEPEENQAVVREFLKSTEDFQLEPGPKNPNDPPREYWDQEGFFNTFPEQSEMDGMFAARLKSVAK